jgi:hypothetical protein
MKSHAIKVAMLGLLSCVLLQSGHAYAYGALLRLRAGNGALDPSFGTGGEVFTTGAADSFSSLFLTSNRTYAGGSITNTNGTISPVVRRYQTNGTPDLSFTSTSTGTGISILPSLTSAPGRVFGVAQDSSQRPIALCGDGTNVWLTRLYNYGNVDTTYGNYPTKPGISLPFGTGQRALTPVGMKLLSDNRTLVVAQNADGSPGFSLARVSTAGIPDLISVGNSFGEVATVAYARDFDADAYGNIAVVGQSSSNDFGMITLHKDAVVPDKLVVGFRETKHYTAYPNNGTYGAAVVFDWTTMITVAVAVAASPQHPVAGIRIPIRRYQSGGNMYGDTWTLNQDGWGGTISLGTVPQTTAPTWKLSSFAEYDSWGFPVPKYYVSGYSNMSSGSLQFEVVKLNGTVGNFLETSFGTSGEAHVPVSGYNAAGFAIGTVPQSANPVIAGIVY